MTTPTSFDQIKKILVPVDLSPLSERAVTAAKALMHELPGSRLTLVLAVEPVFSILAPVFLGSMSTPEGQLAEAKSKLESFRDRLAPGADCQVLDGAAWVEICKAGEAADLIVLSSHGRTGLARAWLGSVAENVLRHAPCSVLVVKPLVGHGTLHLHKVLVGVDYAAGRHPSVEFAEGLPDEAAREITLVSAAPPLVPVMLDMPYPSLASEIDFVAAVDKKLVEIKSTMKHAAFVKCRAYMGTPWRVLVDLARDEGVGLIVIGEHSKEHGGAILGTTAELTVRHAPCAVLVVRNKSLPKPS